MLNNTYYFQHDYNAAYDEKILYLRSIYGMEGYGLYWYLIELMHQSQNSKLKCKLINGIAYQLNIDIDLLLSFYNNCIEIGLFVTDDEFYWSERVLVNKEIQDEKRKIKSLAGKKGMQNRWGNNNEITNDNTVITEDNKRKESKVKEKEIKVKESKVKEIKDIYVQPTVDPYNLFLENIEPLKNLLGNSYQEFIDYWCEPSKSGKLRYESEKFFDIKRRINTWIKNKNKYGNTKNTDPTSSSRERMEALSNWVNS